MKNEDEDEALLQICATTKDEILEIDLHSQHPCVKWTVLSKESPLPHLKGHQISG